MGKLRTVLVDPGHFIARAGDEGDSMYFIKKGSVQVRSSISSRLVE